MLFDAKLQFRSNEMKEETYQQIKVNTDELIEHITNEKTEIGNVRGKLSSLTIESVTNEPQLPAQTPPVETQAEAPKVEAPQAPAEEKPVTVTANTENRDAAWLNQVIQQ